MALPEMHLPLPARHVSQLSLPPHMQSGPYLPQPSYVTKGKGLSIDTSFIHQSKYPLYAQSVNSTANSASGTTSATTRGAARKSPVQTITPKATAAKVPVSKAIKGVRAKLPSLKCVLSSDTGPRPVSSISSSASKRNKTVRCRYAPNWW
jgi:hypothetical protein